MKTKFIVNPISGKNKQKNIEKILDRYLNKNRFKYDISYTKKKLHAKELAEQAIKDNYEIIVSVGGDGTLNEITSGVIGKDVIVGVIPAGSGNGFARHLGIPLKFPEAIKTVLNGKSIIVDSGEIGEEKFVGVAGVGFDAFISKKFDEAPTRGFWTYLKLTVKEYLSYKEKEYILNFDGEERKVKALIMSFCNSSQWGNDAFIAPKANTQDGFLRLVLVRKMPFIVVPFFAFKLFKKKIHTSKYYKEFKVSNVNVQQSERLIHIDGEPVEFHNEFTVKSNPNSLSVII